MRKRKRRYRTTIYIAFCLFVVPFHLACYFCIVLYFYSTCSVICERLTQSVVWQEATQKEGTVRKEGKLKNGEKQRKGRIKNEYQKMIMDRTEGDED